MHTLQGIPHFQLGTIVLARGHLLSLQENSKVCSLEELITVHTQILNLPQLLMGGSRAGFPI